MNITWESALLPSICMVIGVGLYHAKPVGIEVSPCPHFELIWVLAGHRRPPRAIFRLVNWQILHIRHASYFEFKVKNQAADAIARSWEDVPHHLDTARRLYKQEAKTFHSNERRNG